MRKVSWQKWTVLLGSGAFLMQVPGCTETAAVWTAVFSGLTTGGVFYLIRRILE
ncbi:MAG: hypothetical protein KKB50_12475 [Planctomycetes bacterium]|nr:hypothetical protein [Planctomycetota bacterium]